jgi:dihydroorotase
MIGLESALPLLLGLVREGVLSPSEAIAKVTCNPARILGVSLGTLAVDMPVDLTVIDPEEKYVLDCTSFRSRSRNCPFHGRAMQGRIVMTLAEGRVVFST